MRVLFSFAFGCLFTFLLFVLLPITHGVPLISVVWLLSPGFFLFSLFSGKWFGFDCANADSIRDKLTCAWVGLAADVLIYSAICYVLLWLIWRPKRPLENMEYSGKILRI